MADSLPHTRLRSVIGPRSHLRRLRAGRRRPSPVFYGHLADKRYRSDNGYEVDSNICWRVDYEQPSAMGGCRRRIAENRNSRWACALPNAAPQVTLINASNQLMKPTAPFRNERSVLAATPCRGVSVSR